MVVHFVFAEINFLATGAPKLARNFSWFPWWWFGETWKKLWFNLYRHSFDGWAVNDRSLNLKQRGASGGRWVGLKYFRDFRIQFHNSTRFRSMTNKIVFEWIYLLLNYTLAVVTRPTYFSLHWRRYHRLFHYLRSALERCFALQQSQH